MSIALFEETSPVSLLLQFQWLSQTQLAKALGVNPSAVSRWMCGATKPSRTIQRLAWELLQILNKWPLPFPPKIETAELDPLQLLKKFNISRDTLAEALGVSVRAIGHWINGHNKPSRKVRRLAHQLNQKWVVLTG
ncbi:MAG: helix-turn-helix domain-containing protein [Okeania sp. SIO3B5]|uniref:helix-turn-helix transcriptional regulator n=1 Tax=Okeania sp. SIO3B5 TaxID=2607811 RepID=UPI0013FF9677|nr:helix-turn-helix transcriptional regulator [Okeania sp. SIO3B5]NEO52602.1 helix-turn-helix domain-containing protein [Okeania sp. SIO3B5]